MLKLVLLRHGESVWNKENRFTGWIDVGLSEKGVEEALSAGQILKEKGFKFDKVYTSYLKRAIKTSWIVLEELDLMWIEEVKSWRLNERHYGDLQGLNKEEMAAKVGAEQVHIWRRSFDTPPPALEINDERHPAGDPRYMALDSKDIPATESLKTTIERLMPYWEGSIVPDLKDGKELLIVAHGNSLRGLIKHLDGISDEAIVDLNIPTGVPLVYELDENLKPIKSYYLENSATGGRQMES